MSNQDDFDFEDDFLNDDNEPFDFDEEEGGPTGLGDEFAEDMPEIEEEQADHGPNRTFIFLAGVMIILFIAALAVVLFLATRNNGPSDLELTASQVVMLNLTVEIQAAGTGTQSAFNLGLTQTAAAWTPTPSPTLSPTPSEIPTDTTTPMPTDTLQATITPTPTLNETDLANQQLVAGALTLTALAGQATLTPTPAPVGLDLQSAFATQLAYATQQGQFDQSSFSTRIAFATQNANTAGDSQAEIDLRNGLDATSTALNSQSGSAATAIAFIDGQLATIAVQNLPLATQLAIVIPAGIQTQAALGTPFAQATVAAFGTQSAFGTMSAQMNSAPQSGTSATATPAVTAAGKTAVDPVGRVQQDATNAVIATRDSFSTQAIGATFQFIATQASFATQNAFVTPPAFATQSAFATQIALATRQALINMALGLGGSPTPNTNGLAAVNQTATAIAGAFLTATAQAFTPGAPTNAIAAFPTAVATKLPQTGIFDDVASGGTSGLGVLALAVFGLVGVIAVSRRLRTVNSEADRREEQAAPVQTVVSQSNEPPETPKDE